MYYDKFVETALHLTKTKPTHMKAILFFVLAGLTGIGSVTMPSATETANLTVSYVVLNTKEGYSYEAKLVIYVDGKQAGESTAQDQKIPGSVTLAVPTGQHHFKAVLLAYYDGVWEERTIANEYSNDFVWEKDGTLKKDLKVKLYFDIDNGVGVNKKPKKVKLKK